jgi:hypothetical protein
LRKNWHGQDDGQQQSEDGAVFHFNFLQVLGSGKSTPNAFGRLFLMRRLTGRQAPTQQMLQKACLKKPAPYRGPAFL